MEHTESANQIFVSNLPIGNNKLYFISKDEHNKSKRKLLSIFNGLNKIEEVFLDTIDILTKKSLSQINDIEYNVAGGKAINNIIKYKYLSKSFDFDIHVQNITDISRLGLRVVDLMNHELEHKYNKYIRYQLFKKLQKLNFVSEDEKSYYMNTSNKLFYYGTRVKQVNPLFVIHGMFVKLKLQKNVFLEVNGGVESPIKINNYLSSETSGENPFASPNNIIYIPFSDIDAESKLNFNLKSNVKVYKTRTPNRSIYVKQNIKYLDYPVILYNLISYIAFSQIKSPNNIKKLRNIIRPLRMYCTFANTYDNAKIIDTLKNLAQQLNVAVFPPFNKTAIQILNTYPIMIKYDSPEKKNLFDRFDSIDVKVILNNIFNNYFGFRQNIVNACKPVIKPTATLADIDSSNFKPFYQTNIPTRNADLETFKNTLLGKLEKITSQYDKNECIYHYTDGFYKSLNTYSNLKENGIDPPDFEPYNIPVRSHQIRFSDGDSLTKNIKMSINSIADIEAEIKNIDKIYEDFHRQLQVDTFTTMPPANVRMAADNTTDRGNKVINYIEDVFTVYSLKLLFNYNQYTNEYYNISSLKPGDVFVYPEYISTTYSYDTNLSAFINENKILFRITINKNIKKWIMINKYSKYPSEKEILLNHNSKFIVKNISTAVVDTNATKVETHMIDLELLDDIAPIEILQKIFKTSGAIDYNDNPLKSALFNITAETVLRDYLLNEYADCKYFRDNNINCTTKVMLLEDQFQKLTVNKKEIILYRPNHGLAHTLRVCLWIYIYSLFLLKYDSTLINMITPKYILQLCIVGLFLVSGRESENGWGNDVQSCNPLTTEEKTYYLNSHSRYREYSANQFNQFVNSVLIENTIFTPTEIQDFQHCLKDYYNIHKGINQSPLDTKPINQLTSKIFYMSHIIDLVRCKQDCEIVVPIAPAHANYNKEFNIISNFAIELCRVTGDRILIKYFKDSQTLKKTDIRINFTYDHEKFYNNSTDVTTCISTILDVTTPYTNEMIADIEENLKNFNFNNFNINSHLINPGDISAYVKLPNPPVLVPAPGDISAYVKLPNAPVLVPAPGSSFLPPAPAHLLGLPGPAPPKPSTLPKPPAPAPTNAQALSFLPPAPPKSPAPPKPPAPGSSFLLKAPADLLGLPLAPTHGGNKSEEILENDYETDVDYAITSTNNSIIGTRFFVPRKYVEEYKKLYPHFLIVPNLSEFGGRDLNLKSFDSSFDYYDYINKRINYYYEKGFDIYDEVKDEELIVDSIEILNPVSNEDYIRRLNEIKQNNEKYAKLYKQEPSKIINSNTQQNVPVMAYGGNRDKYYMKYLKYKQKYLDLKNNL